MVMDFDATLSTEIAMLSIDKNAYYHDLMIRGMPRNDAGQQIPSFLAPATAVIPKGAKNVEVAKEFMKFFIQPEVDGEYVKAAVRWLPVMPKQAMKDPWWTDPKLDPFRPVYFRQGMIDPTLPYWWIGNPAYAEVWTQELWDIDFQHIVNGAMTPKQAADTAFERIKKIFAKYPIAQA
jgi:multiple sugar transport system substrate-binding protein